MGKRKSKSKNKAKLPQRIYVERLEEDDGDFLLAHEGIDGLDGDRVVGVYELVLPLKQLEVKRTLKDVL